MTLFIGEKSLIRGGEFDGRTFESRPNDEETQEVEENIDATQRVLFDMKEGLRNLAGLAGVRLEPGSLYRIPDLSQACPDEGIQLARFDGGGSANAFGAKIEALFREVHGLRREVASIESGVVRPSARLNLKAGDGSRTYLPEPDRGDESVRLKLTFYSDGRVKGAEILGSDLPEADQSVILSSIRRSQISFSARERPKGGAAVVEVRLGTPKPWPHKWEEARARSRPL